MGGRERLKRISIVPICTEKYTLNLKRLMIYDHFDDFGKETDKRKECKMCDQMLLGFQIKEI